MKLAWLTDIHLNFLDNSTRKKFYDEILTASCDALLISGDIWRRGRDSNPGKVALQRFSRPPLSTAQPPLRQGRIVS
jgi:predicted MPP superfamily phosphohydrolase